MRSTPTSFTPQHIMPYKRNTSSSAGQPCRHNMDRPGVGAVHFTTTDAVSLGDNRGTAPGSQFCRDIQECRYYGAECRDDGRNVEDDAGDVPQMPGPRHSSCHSHLLELRSQDDVSYPRRPCGLRGLLPRGQAPSAHAEPAGTHPAPSLPAPTWVPAFNHTAHQPAADMHYEYDQSPSVMYWTP